MTEASIATEHSITRHRHEPKRRRLAVTDKRYVTPHMIRIEFASEDLADFTSLSPSDHVKVFLPIDGGEPERRDYTPRRFNPVTQTLTLDFAVHEAGPATRWAVEAEVGDALEVGGPRGSAVVSDTFDWWLLIGDETALPSIGRRFEELPRARIISLVTVTDAGEEQDIAGGERHEAIWVHRPAGRNDDAEPLLAALRSFELPEGEGFVWIAAEAKVARTVRDFVTGELGHPSAWTKAAGYWLKGIADAHEKIPD